MKTFLMILAMTFTLPALASYDEANDTSCYRLSKDGKGYSRTPETLCVQGRNLETLAVGTVKITLTSGMPMNAQKIAEFNLNFLGGSRCLECNQDEYGVATPENSVFNSLKIKFNGKLDYRTRAESGTLTIGKNKFFYESL